MQCSTAFTATRPQEPDTLRRMVLWQPTNFWMLIRMQLTVGTNKYYFNTNGVMATGLTNIGGVTYLFGADGAMQYGWYTDASGMRYFQTNGAMAVNTTLAVGGVTYVFDANGLATAVPVINPATWVTDPATGVTIDTATGAVVPAETVAAAAAIAQK